MMRHSAVLLLIVLLAGFVDSQSEGCRNENEIINQILLNYDKKIGPREVPLTTDVELWIQHIYEIDQQNKELKLDVYISTKWDDDRLRYAHLSPCRRDVTLADASALWTPDIVFTNSKKAQIHSSPVSNNLGHVSASGKVWTNQRVKLTLPCTFETVFRYPFDEVICESALESFRLGNRQLFLNWTAQAVQYLSNSTLSGFTLTNTSVTREIKVYPLGEWTQLSFKLIFHRVATTVLLYTFIPAILAVFAAGITFFLGRKSSVARAILAASALFFLIYLMKEVNKESPTFSGLKMIDIYLFVCILFACSALIELALANGCSNRGQYKLNENDGFKPLNQSETPGSGGPVRFCRRHCGKFDVSAGVLYFGLFIVWNVVYFLVIVAI